ncbi:KIF1binding protein -like protein [Caligus rogercresseyi]|uniref:KIF1binding protein -like protein n=1 Tax=Caligus rogercresseyi TaxID=217165 RepID=A0A7T8GL07_CALRO|nr:KIF1binding protein -like protein [Caligus rogercresseyi]
MHSLIKIEGTSPKEAFRLHRRQLEAMDAILKVLNPTHYMENHGLFGRSPFAYWSPCWSSEGRISSGMSSSPLPFVT